MVQYTAPSSASDRNGYSSGGVHCRALRGASSGRVPRASNNGGGIETESRDVADSLSFNCGCEQQRRCGVTSHQLLLRAEETLRRHFPLTAVANSRGVAASRLSTAAAAAAKC